MEITLMNVLYVLQFALSMIIRLLVYYWYANEIILEVNSCILINGIY